MWNGMELHLDKLNWFHGRKGPLLLIIMDGVGVGPENDANALYLAHTPTLDALFQGDLYTELQAHGTAVGLPTDDDMGNSEVGHNALGAGRVFAQGARLVNEAIESRRIFRSEAWRDIADRARSGGTVHFMGLLSDGNVHSHIHHLYSMVNQCADSGFERVRVHALLDGRDVGERSALDYVIPTQDLLQRISTGHAFDYAIASGGGRMRVTMDRYYADWDIVQRGWEAHVHGKARQFRSAEEAIRTFYREDPEMTDQYMDAFVVVNGKGDPLGPIRDGDAVVLFNFRGDRAIEISEAFTLDEFKGFDRGDRPDALFAGMMQYDGDTGMPPRFLVEPPVIEKTVSEYLCAAGVSMFAISETQKFGHVTYFWNGNRSGYIDRSLETYVEIPSDRIEFDRAPRMKAHEIKERAAAMLREGAYRFGRLNFANGDMVGHTGSMEAAVVAAETVDQCVGDLLAVTKELEGIAVITADHGNLDVMFTQGREGEKVVKTAHTLNPVPFAIFDPLYGKEYGMASLERAGLSNVAATLLNLLGFEKPEEFDPSLIEPR
jgi:2,3-bisphosphoglycerate-independent phosphoglycerate mutase